MRLADSPRHLLPSRHRRCSTTGRSRLARRSCHQRMPNLPVLGDLHAAGTNCRRLPNIAAAAVLGTNHERPRRRRSHRGCVRATRTAPLQLSMSADPSTGTCHHGESLVWEQLFRARVGKPSWRLNHALKESLYTRRATRCHCHYGRFDRICFCLLSMPRGRRRGARSV